MTPRTNAFVYRRFAFENYQIFYKLDVSSCTFSCSFSKETFKHASSSVNRISASRLPGAYVGGCTGYTCASPPPNWEKNSAQKCPKEKRKFRPDMSAKKNVHVPLRYDKIKTKKVRKKKIEVKEKDEMKEIKKEDSRLSEIEIIK